MNDEKYLFWSCRLDRKVSNTKANIMQAFTSYEEICLKFEVYACPYFLKAKQNKRTNKKPPKYCLRSLLLTVTVPFCGFSFVY